MRCPTGGVMSISAPPALSGGADLAVATNERNSRTPGKIQRASSLVGFMKRCNDEGAAKSFKHIFPRRRAATGNSRARCPHAFVWHTLQSTPRLSARRPPAAPIHDRIRLADLAPRTRLIGRRQNLGLP